MLEKYIPKRYANALLKHVLAVTLFFPYCYSITENSYNSEFSVAIFFSLLSLITIFTSWKLTLSNNRIFICILSGLLIVYNIISTYINFNYHHWYSEQINTTIAFLLFIVLLCVKEETQLIDRKLITASIPLVVISNILALYYKFTTNNSTHYFFNTEIRTEKSGEARTQFSWLYFHKSQYAFILVICIAFFSVYKTYFRHKILYWLCQILLFAALFASDTYASIVAALFIFAGDFADYWLRAKIKFKIISLALIALPFFFGVSTVLKTMSDNRSTLTLGARIYIWPAFIEHIKNNPHGLGLAFGIKALPVENFVVRNNAHNVFLNHMLHLSIPVGILFTLFFLVIIIFSFIKNFSFLTLGIWIAFLVPMCMDYTLFVSETPFFLFVIYCIFFRKDRPKKALT